MSELDMVAMVIVTAAGAGVVMARRYHQWLRRTRRVEGVVVDQVETGETNAGTFYYAVVEFVDAGGQRIRFTDRFGHGGQPLFPVGSAVSVDYELSDPGEAHIHNSAASTLIGLVALVVGSFLLGVGLWSQ